jgi:hypothetical protein
MMKKSARNGGMLLCAHEAPALWVAIPVWAA